MTRYLQPLKRVDGRWDYTSSTGSSDPYPLGYCAGWKEPPTGEEAARLNARFGSDFVESLTYEIEAVRSHQHLFHGEGHATAAEAIACYRGYQLDHELELLGPDPEARTLHRCQGPDCREYTSGCAILGHGYSRNFYLCDAHRNRETLEGLVR